MERKGRTSATTEVVQAAEQTVAEAWVKILLEAEEAARAAAEASLSLRSRVATQLRAAQECHDPVAMSVLQARLEGAEEACEHAVNRYRLVRATLASELTTWAADQRRRRG